MLVLAEAGLRPSFIIGGDVTDMGTGAHWTGGEWLVVEADESDGTHLELPLHGTILTNVEVDHLDHYGTFEAHRRRLRPLPRRRSPGRRCCAPTTRCCAELAARATAPSRTALAAAPTSGPSTCRPTDGALRFDVVAHDGEPLGACRPAAARHPQRAQRRSVRWRWRSSSACRSTSPPARPGRFGGVARRFDIRGVDGGATLVDDYAHLPSEIAAVLARRARAAATAGGGSWPSSSPTASTAWP